MHISDGVLPAAVCIGGYVLTGGFIAVLIKRIDMASLPKISVITAVFFVASLIHIPLGITSVHLILNGLVGVFLGWDAFISIFIGIVLQALLFQHGGLTTIGVNTCMMGLPALLGAWVFSFRRWFINERNAKLVNGVFGVIVGVLAIIVSTTILALLLISAGENFIAIAQYAALANVPVMVIEGIICGFTVSFLSTVKPELLERRKLL